MEYYSEHGVEILRVVFADVVSVKKYSSLGRVVQSRQQLNERSFSGSVKSDKHAGVPRLKSEADVVYYLALRSGIGKGNVVEHDGMSGMMLHLARFFEKRNYSALFVHE